MKKINIKYTLVEKKTKPFDRTQLDYEFELVSDGEELENKETEQLYNLYIRITYNRKTTQFKSFISETYHNIEEFYKKHRTMMDYELKLVYDIMCKRIKRDGEDTTPKGLGEIVKKYNKKLSDATFQEFEEIFTKEVLNSKSEFRGLFIVDSENLSSLTTVLKAYIKLFDEPESLVRILPQARMYDMLDAYLDLRKEQNLGVHLLDWLYGDLSKGFIEKMKSDGTSDEIIENVISTINVDLRTRKLT